MDHNDMGHGGMGNGGRCKMNMLFNWDTKDLCILFPGWHIRGTTSLIFSLLAIVLLTACYEGIRDITRRYEALHVQDLRAYVNSATVDEAPDELLSPTTVAPDMGAPINGLHGHHDISSPLLVGRDSKIALDRKGRVIKALLYAVQVSYSFFIMLLFMTYNGWVMLSIGIGAFLGHLIFTGPTAVKTVACH